MPFVVGEQVGPYRIVEQLGQGGMSTVFKAYHAALDRYVAMKVLHPVFKGDQGFLARFQREARIVARLEHPHIVPVYDFSEHEGTPYLVMRYIEGRTLKALMGTEPPLSLERMVEVFTAVCDALEYAHGQGVLHRDIKPSNILLSCEGKVYVTDFGLARMAQSGDSTISQDRMIGTPQYISPEQAKGEPLDHRTDLYSLGVVLFEMLAGRVPYTADTPFAVVHDHIFSPLPMPSSLNPAVAPAVEKVVLKALAKSPADRYQSAGEFLRALTAAVQEVRQALAAPQPISPPPAEATPAPVPHEAPPRAVPPEVTLPAAPTPPLPLEVAEPVVALPAEGETVPLEAGAAGEEKAGRPARRRLWIWIGAGLVGILAAVGAVLLVVRPWVPRGEQPQVQQPTPKPGKAPFPLAASEVYPRLGEPMPPEQAQRAVQELKPRLEQEPKNALLRVKLGDALFDLGEWERAVVAYKEAIDVDPKLAVGHYDLGTTLLHLRRTEDAVRHLQIAVDLRPEEAQAWFNLGVAQALAGHDQEASAALKKFQQMHPQRDAWSERAGRLLEWLRSP